MYYIITVFSKNNVTHSIEFILFLLIYTYTCNECAHVYYFFRYLSIVNWIFILVFFDSIYQFRCVQCYISTTCCLYNKSKCTGSWLTSTHVYLLNQLQNCSFVNITLCKVLKSIYKSFYLNHQSP